eukprot:TRINITY_DN23695_c0_g1_i1.p1 TRINITY_DN23695_c0_g1~~TRINITY_DN23695_c0_g1_i1.p1  ORF type:complete len:825 (-),score=228.27 TRINITY_DN23695_c0_g1_i1:585-3059(-)
MFLRARRLSASPVARSRMMAAVPLASLNLGIQAQSAQHVDGLGGQQASASLAAPRTTGRPSGWQSLRQSSFSASANPFFSSGAAHLVAAQARSQPLTRQQASVRCHAAVAEAEAPAVEQYEYQAEVSRLLDLIVHSLYSNKEVFLRELVSNASDALDKMRFLSLTDPALLGDSPDLEIRIKTDKDAGTITISDSGVGMTRDELVALLGTIAESGTNKFVKAMKEKKEEGAATDSNLIGQFGVGFYSAFLVADKVTVSTKSAKSDKQWVWEAEAGASSYTVAEETDGERMLPRGTAITLHLKEDDRSEYTDQFRIQSLVKNYSQFIAFPIYTWQEKTKSVEVEESEPVAEGEEPKTKKKTVQEKYFDWELMNQTKPIWMRSTKEVAKEEYNEFFKTTFKEFIDPLAYTHFVTEGEIEFRSLLYIPGMAPFQPEQNYMSDKQKNIRLYVKRVFISDEFNGELFPRYLKFISGVVDSNDLPLNVSREILQESRIVKIMRKRLVRKTFDMLDEIAEREDKSDYETFWTNFGKFLKLGVLEDQTSHKRIAPLLRFFSSKGEDKLITLDEYVERMKEGQGSIFFLAADSMSNAKSAPFLEKLAKNDLEVLFLLEPLDEPILAQLAKYKEKKFVDVTKEDLDLGEAVDKEKEREVEKETQVLCDWIKLQLGDKIAKVQISRRLESSPCVLVAGKFAWSANMEKLMRAQMGDNDQVEFQRSQRILEINPSHPIIRELNFQAKNKPNGEKAQKMVRVLYEAAHLASGFPPSNPADFAEGVYELMGDSIAKQQQERDEVDRLVEEQRKTRSATEGEAAEVVEPSEIRTEKDAWS